MSRVLALLAVLIAAFLVLVGVLGVFAGIAPAFPTTEESFTKFGSMPEIKDIVLVIVSVVFVAAGYFLTRFAGKMSVKEAAATPAT
jgi:archaellum biogenesis protein FlaJ (TadC family)